jgi:cation:H+ antiporter
MLVATFALAFIAQTSEIGRVAGVVLTLGIVAYVVFSYLSEARNPKSPSAELHAHESAEIEVSASLGAGVGYLLAGLAALVIGSRLLILGSTDIARVLGVSEAVIGLSIVAIGTSLPELATSVVAALRRHADVAVGNVIGSNIFNILGILGITALVRPIGVAEQIVSIDVWVMTAVSLALAFLLLKRGRIGRIVGVVFLLLYATYLAVLFRATAG